jgi:hypothetical protein
VIDEVYKNMSEAWSETALITVVGTTGTITAAMNIAALTDTIDIDQGDRDIEGKKQKASLFSFSFCF